METNQPKYPDRYNDRNLVFEWGGFTFFPDDSPREHAFVAYKGACSFRPTAAHGLGEGEPAIVNQDGSITLSGWKERWGKPESLSDKIMAARRNGMIWARDGYRVKTAGGMKMDDSNDNSAGNLDHQPAGLVGG